MMKATLTIALLAFVHTACGGKDDKTATPPQQDGKTSEDAAEKKNPDPAASSEETKKPADPANDPAPAPMTDSAALQGTWGFSCQASPQEETSYKGQTIISNNEMRHISISYSDKTCEKVAIRGEHIFTLKLGSASKVVPGAIEVEELFTLSKMTYMNQKDVDLLNANKTCNKTDWKVGVAGDCPAASSTSSFGLLAVKNNKLYFPEYDAAHDGSTAEKRPIKLYAEGMPKL